MSNRELLERCLEAVSVSDYVSYDILMNDIRAELSKPSQKNDYEQLKNNLGSEKETNAIYRAEIDELKAKLAEAEKDAYYFHIIDNNQYFYRDNDFVGEPYYGTKSRVIASGKTLREAMQRLIAKNSNNIKELG